MDWNFTCPPTESSKICSDINSYQKKISQSFDRFSQNQNCQNQKNTAICRIPPDNRQKRGKESNHRAGDWICNMCNNHNYSFREICNSCKLQTKINNLKESLSRCDNEQKESLSTLKEISKFRKKLSIKSGCQFEKMMNDKKSTNGYKDPLLEFPQRTHQQNSKKTSHDTESGSRKASEDSLADCPPLVFELERTMNANSGLINFVTVKSEGFNEKAFREHSKCKDRNDKNGESAEEFFCEFPFQKETLFSDKEIEEGSEYSEESENESTSIEIDKKTLELLALD